MHKLITLEKVVEAVERYNLTTDNPGFCTSCGIEVDGVEPDAANYECDNCGERQVYGAEQLLMEMF